MKDIEKLEDLVPDAENANEGTVRGAQLLDHSISQYGAGRSIVSDRNGVIIAGNKTHESAVERGLGVRIVKSDGKKLVVVQRTDLDLKNVPGARELAYLDNRSSELGLKWDKAQLEKDLRAGIDLGTMFTAAELEVQLDVQAPDGWTSSADTPKHPPALTAQIPFVTIDQHNRWMALLMHLGDIYPDGSIASKIMRWVGEQLPKLAAEQGDDAVEGVVAEEG